LEREHAIAHERIVMLIQELTHRVKNSLQLIAAMVFIEARDHKRGEGKAALERVSHRIDALGLRAGYGLCKSRLRISPAANRCQGQRVITPLIA
jgi:hypothetical protein